MKTYGWAIKGVFGFYTGWWLTKPDAIKQHCADLGKSWAYCRKKGDRAVRVCIKEIDVNQYYQWIKPKGKERK